MNAAVVAAGLVLVAAALFDLAWTAVAAGSGAGPIASRVASITWTAALAVHRRRPSHRLLSVAGVAIVFVVLAVWLALALAGWTLVFTAVPGAVLDSTTAEPGDLVSRLYFVGYTVFTLGNGDYRPGAGIWQLATSVAAGTGLVLVTLSLTYLVPVASAVAQRRQLASYIHSLGDTPQAILTNAWTGTGFDGLGQHLTALAPTLHGIREQHHTYPVLHYFHSTETASAAAPNIANLGGALELLHHGVAASARPAPGETGPVTVALDRYLATMGDTFVAGDDQPLAAPTLQPLRDAGGPCVDDDAYQRAADTTRQRRQRLAALLSDDGW